MSRKKKENDSFGWRRQMCLLIVQPVFFFFALWLCSISLELCLARHHHLSLLWGMAQGNIYDALCTKWVQPFKSPEQLNSSSSHFSSEERLCSNNRTRGVRGATGPGQYLWCFMHQMGSTVQITRATEQQQQQSLLLWTAPLQIQQNRGSRGALLLRTAPSYGAHFIIQRLRATTANLSQARSDILP